MKIKFEKYQGTGNDFIIIDARNKPAISLPVAQMCDRKFGIGADGLMLLTSEESYDFGMVYYNADGNISTMCGNGGRCLSAYAHALGIGKKNKLHFLAIDGPHDAEIINHQLVSLQMIDVQQIQTLHGNAFELNTGSPHYVSFVSQLKEMNIVNEAKLIRYNDKYKNTGINVNFVSVNKDNHLDIRTYERGVEDETLSCGTGVTACALAYAKNISLPDGSHTIKLNTMGGLLEVSFTKKGDSYHTIWLKGPAIHVFSGEWPFNSGAFTV
jgi:diaminopimelate epimerase